MPRTPCYLYDITIRWRDPDSNEWLDFDVLSLSWHSLRSVCDLFEGCPIEVVGNAEGVRVVNSSRLVADLCKRKLPVRTFTKIREVAKAEGVLDYPFHCIGFGPGLAWVHG